MYSNSPNILCNTLKKNIKNNSRSTERLLFKCWHLPIFPDRHQSSIFGTIELNFRVRHQSSIFGTIELNFRVRYGNGCTLNVINTNLFNSSPYIRRLCYYITYSYKLQAFFQKIIIPFVYTGNIQIVIPICSKNFLTLLTVNKKTTALLDGCFIVLASSYFSRSSPIKYFRHH